MRNYKNILITGGAGFIGSHVVRNFVQKYERYNIVNLDLLTYAGNLDNLADIQQSSNYVFEKGDIRDASLVKKLFEKYQFDSVIHLAAESHVDRSINNPLEFITTNVHGTAVLLNACLDLWKDDYKDKLFYHISTDEVYGSLGKQGYFTETTPYAPRSPYSSSKASSDLLVLSYYSTYGLPVVISNCSNNYGPNQFPEKLIPLMIYNAMQDKNLPIYGEGANIRDWLWVLDHVEAIDTILHNGRIGEKYNIGGHNEIANISLVKKICSIVDKHLKRAEGYSEKLIVFVKDRLGHDFRYAIDASKIEQELHWKPKIDVETGIENTVLWYLNNPKWLERIFSNEYRNNV